MAVRLGIRGRLFFASLSVMLVVGLPAGLYLEHKLRGWLEARITGELTHHARVAAEAARSGQWSLPELAHRVGEATDCRITVIAHDGRVLGDSEVVEARLSELDDHSDRPEVVAARADGFGTSRRTSATLDTQLLYVAISAPVQGQPGVIRAAVPLADIQAIIVRLRALLGSGVLVGLIVALVMTYWASALAARPVRALVDRSRPLVHAEPSSLSEPPDPDEDDLAPGSVARLARELERTLAALAHERDRFETVLEGMSEAVLAIDAEQRVALANPAAEALLELRLDGPRVALSDVVQAPDLLRLAKEGATGPASSEFTYGERNVLARATPLVSARGTVIVMHDVSEMRRLETVRKDFVANVSHELRTPVSIIRANAETLLDGGLEDPSRNRSFVDAIHRHAERLSNLLADLLDLSRIEAGRYQLSFRNLDCETVVKRGVEAVEAKASGRQILTTFDTEPNAAVRADPKAVDQILMNLLDNAIKYSGDDDPIQVRVLDAPDGVRFEVVDHGPGIEDEQRGRIFERFYRVDPGRSRDRGGTGLGLAIVKHLAESMGGQVGVAAAEPSGSTFWFTLPRVESASYRPREAETV